MSWGGLGGVNFVDCLPELDAVGFVVYGAKIGIPVCCFFFPVIK